MLDQGWSKKRNHLEISCKKGWIRKQISQSAVLSGLLFSVNDLPSERAALLYQKPRTNRGFWPGRMKFVNRILPDL